MAFRRDRRLLWPPLPPFPHSPALPLFPSLAIWYLGGAWLPVAFFLSAPWHNVVFYGLLSRASFYVSSFECPSLLLLLLFVRFESCLPGWLDGSAPKQLLFIITFYVYILHSAFTFYFVQALTRDFCHSFPASISRLIAAFRCISLLGICVDSLKGMHNAKIP